MRNPMMEIWRMVFAITVALWHTRYLPWCTEQTMLFHSGMLEFFFILSGFLMAQSIVRRNDQQCENIGSETVLFVFSKVKRIFPTFIVALLMDTAFRLAFTSQGIDENPIYYIWDVLFLRVTGLCGDSGDIPPGGAWYLHAVFLAMAILYPLARKYFDVFRHICAPLLAFFIYGWFCDVHGNIYFTMRFSNGICLGLVRAIAGICLGFVCHSVCQWLQCQRLERSKFFGAIVTAAELACFGGAIWIARHCEHSRTDFIMIFLLAAGVICSFCRYSALLRLAEKVPTGWIGKCSLALYLSHYVWVRVLSDWKLPIPFDRQVSVFLILSAVSTFACIRTADLIIQIWKRLRVRLDGRMRKAE